MINKYKIVYAKLRLTISKKALNFKNRYCINGLSTIHTFKKWKAKLRE